MLAAIRELQQATVVIKRIVGESRGTEIRSNSVKALVRDFVEQYWSGHRPRLTPRFGDGLKFADERIEILLRLSQSRSPKKAYLSALKDLDRHWAEYEVRAIKGTVSTTQASGRENSVLTGLLEESRDDEIGKSAGYPDGQGQKRKPSLFVGCSHEALAIAYALQENLEFDAEVTVWDQDVFQLSGTALTDLTGKLPQFDFAVLVFRPDDVVTISGKAQSVVRDNVIFELGLAIGILGRDRVFYVIPRGVCNFHLPTDLVGITPGTFEPNRQDQNLKAALGQWRSSIGELLL